MTARRFAAALRARPQAGLQESGLADAAEILTTSPPDRPYRLLRFYGGFSVPKE